jgi:probable selenium-dependent hydroxylase accessory protein YqeC
MDLFGLRPGAGYVFLIGGGGKTTLLFALARAAVSRGHLAITTTSTRILRPAPEESERVLVHPDPEPNLVEQELEAVAHLTLASSLQPGGPPEKLLGFSVDALDRLRDVRLAEFLLVEADGSAGRSFKAHQSHEPVVSPRADRVIAVIGVDALGKPVDDQHVHRSALLRSRLGLDPEAVLSAELLAEAFFHAEGYLARVARDTPVSVFLSKVRSAQDRAAARRLGEALRRRDFERRLDRLVMGDFGPKFSFSGGPL